MFVFQVEKVVVQRKEVLGGLSLVIKKGSGEREHVQLGLEGQAGVNEEQSVEGTSRM